MFFSGTDWEQLEDRGIEQNYFLMLIVNTRGQACAKVAFKAKLEKNKGTEISLFNNSDGYGVLRLPQEKGKEALVVMDCNVEFEVPPTPLVNEEFAKRFEEVQEAIKSDKAVTVYHHQPYGSGYNPGGSNYGRNNERDYGGKWNNGKWQSGQAGVNEDDEWDYTNGVWKPKEEKKEPKISEMTEKQWNEWNKKTGGEKVWFQKDAREFLNAILHKEEDKTVEYRRGNWMENVVDKLEKLGKAMKLKEERNEWLMEHFDLEMEKAFKYMYPELGEGEYAGLLNECRDYLYPFRWRSEMISDVLESLELEIMDTVDSTQITSVNEQEIDYTGHGIMD